MTAANLEFAVSSGEKEVQSPEGLSGCQTKPAFPALGAPMSPARVHGSPRVEDLALPKSLGCGNFTLANGGHPVDAGSKSGVSRGVAGE
jgi:hypothetical protein